MHSDFDCGSTPLALCETSEICTTNDLRRKRKQFGVLGEVRLRQLGKLTGRVVSLSFSPWARMRSLIASRASYRAMTLMVAVVLTAAPRPATSRMRQPRSAV